MFLAATEVSNSRRLFGMSIFVSVREQLGDHQFTSAADFFLPPCFLPFWSAQMYLVKRKDVAYRYDLMQSLFNAKNRMSCHALLGWTCLDFGF